VWPKWFTELCAICYNNTVEVTVDSQAPLKIDSTVLQLHKATICDHEKVWQTGVRVFLYKVDNWSPATHFKYI